MVLYQKVSSAQADEAALRLAIRKGASLFTNDAALAKAARGKRVPVVSLKGLSHLDIDPRPEE